MKNILGLFESVTVFNKVLKLMESIQKLKTSAKSQSPEIEAALNKLFNGKDAKQLEKDAKDLFMSDNKDGIYEKLEKESLKPCNKIKEEKKYDLIPIDTLKQLGSIVTEMVEIINQLPLEKRQDFALLEKSIACRNIKLQLCHMLNVSREKDFPIEDLLGIITCVIIDREKSEDTALKAQVEEEKYQEPEMIDTTSKNKNNDDDELVQECFNNIMDVYKTKPEDLNAIVSSSLKLLSDNDKCCLKALIMSSHELLYEILKDNDNDLLGDMADC
jgi:hypothetical protein